VASGYAAAQAALARLEGVARQIARMERQGVGARGPRSASRRPFFRAAPDAIDALLEIAEHGS
jgi:hypothetical protein